MKLNPRVRWLGGRLLGALVTLWVVVTLSFVLMRVAPGGPFDRDKPLPPAVQANLQRTFGLAKDIHVGRAGRLVKVLVGAGDTVMPGDVLAVIAPVGGDQPLEVRADRELAVVRVVAQVGAELTTDDVLIVRETGLLEQYGAALGSYLRGDFGVTYTSEGARTVVENLAQGFSVSLELGLYALFIALLVGVGSGLLAGLKADTWVDHAAMGGALLAVSMSSIVLGPLLVLVFCVQLGWLPWGGWQAWSLMPADLAHKVLPSLTLGLVYAAWFSRLVRAGLIDVMKQPWIRAARAKGISELRVVLVHALRPALLPAVSFLGPALAGIVTGSVVIERIFAVPGVGEYFVAAALNRDYPMVMGTVVLYASLLIAANLLVDMLYGVLDPRVRSGGRS